MIYTSSYENCQTNKYNVYSISEDGGRSINYKGKVYSSLAPKESFLTVWKNNIGKLDYDINNKYYIEEYYKQVLSSLDVAQVYNELNNSILVCYENNRQFCHRHIVAAWFELLLGIEVEEILINNGNINKLYRPKYIRYILENYLKYNNTTHNELILNKKRT